MVGNEKNIYVDLDYQNIFLIDPNRVVDRDGTVRERLVDHENLIMYANLECDVLPRTKLALGGAFEGVTKIEIGRINFLNPNSTNDTIRNVSDLGTKPNNSFFTTSTGTEDDVTSLLGITNITIKNNSSFISTVAIELEDVRGRALFEKGDNSPYAAFFNLPWPMFTLTIKGYYGQAVKLSLSLIDFSARFNTGTGNFNVSLTFQQYKYTMISEVTAAALKATPFMYRSKFTERLNQSTNTSQQGSTETKSYTVERGRQKISEVYGEYKAKGLLPDDFPEYTPYELYKKIDVFEKNIENSLSKVDMTSLTDLKKFEDDLKRFDQKVFTSPDSWAKKWLDLNDFIITIDKIPDQTQPDKEVSLKLYILKKEFRGDANNVENAKKELEKLFEEYNKIFSENPTCSPIVTQFVVEEDAVYTSEVSINFDQTFIEQKGRRPSSPVEFDQFKSGLTDNFSPVIVQESNGEIKVNTTFFYLTPYYAKYRLMQKEVEEIRKRVEKEITEKLREKLVEKENGIGFEPTIRNCLAVIFATGEAFLRLMDEVHRKAWDKRNEQKRKQATQTPNNIDNGASGNDTLPVYPWPQFLVATTDSAENGLQYEVQYPGDPKYGKQYDTGDPSIWPEVEFVEEFIFGSTVKETPEVDFGGITNEITEARRLSLNAIEFPIKSNVYAIKESAKFFYEIWERTFIASNYTRLVRDGSKGTIDTAIFQEETKNIINALGTNNPSLTKLLKDYDYNGDNMLSILRHFSNDGLGESWQRLIREDFSIAYIRNMVQNSFGIFNIGILNSSRGTSIERDENVDKIKNYIEGTTTNSFNICDVAPFTNLRWVRSNMANAEFSINTERQLTNTTNSVFYNQDHNAITNFKVDGEPNKIVPITNFNYLGVAEVPTINFGLDLFYINRSIKDQFPTEGTIKYSGTSQFFFSDQTTSMLNTPVFINSIQTGVRNFQSNNPYPFKSAAYLFLNSLPLGTLREKYKTYESGAVNDLDYIFMSLKKFGAVHRLPYVWILKYGSIWHRYKEWVETGNDIINNDWSNFDYTTNYDPITLATNKSYNLNITEPNGVSSSVQIILEDSQQINPIQLNTVINTGFYPALINDYNLFCQGDYLFGGYTDPDIQNEINNNNFIIVPGSVDNPVDLNGGSKILGSFGFDLSNTGRTMFVNTWTCLATNKSKDTNDANTVFVLPSFGTNINQTKFECFDTFLPIPIMKTELTGNTAMYNGSVRLFWAAPNYGYFDINRITKPRPDQYLKQVYFNQSTQENFSLVESGYTDISEIFGTFDKEILDLFENEFLKFSKSIYDFNPSDGDSDYKKFGNFQLVLRDLLKIQKPQGSTVEEFIRNAQQNQVQKVFEKIKAFMEYSIIFKFGNPSNFNRKIFFSFSNNIIQDPYQYFPYIQNSLPTSGGTTTLAISKITYPNAWLALETYVGFSNIQELVYDNDGSYITDFFVDMNVEFSEVNVTNLSPLIKIYATQKLKDPTLDETKFRELITTYLTNNSDFQNIVLTNLFTDLTKKLPQIEEEPDTIVPIVDDKIKKVEIWESFKALNDKWISGFDFTNKTLFEDVLLLDRSNRDIGNKVFIDIFEFKSMLFSITQDGNKGDKGNLLFYVKSVLAQNNFQVFHSPSYVNFYNVQDVVKDAIPKLDNSTEFANMLFGTFNTVDTRSSSPKLVCVYVGKPSDSLKMPENKNVKYRNDSFNMGQVNNPLATDLTNKTDWALSNRAVGFNVDMGLRNQNVFYNIQVDQNPGKATSESFQAITDMVNQAAGRKTSTQNQSNYNFYKTRSYTCTISCLGNAMIQPTMYFNLRHVPMFEGTYLILDVNHTINPGRFETIVTGVRVPIYNYPIPDFLLSSINTTLLTALKQKLKSDREKPQTEGGATNQIQEKTDGEANIEGSATPVTNTEQCQQKLDTKYQIYTAVDPVETSLSYISTKQALKNRTSEEKVQIMAFVTMFVYSIDNQSLAGYNFNFTYVPMDMDWGNLVAYMASNKNYICLNVGESTNQGSRPYAVFDDTSQFMNFIVNKWSFLVNSSDFDSNSVDIVTKYLLNYYPKTGTGLYNTYASSSDQTTLQKYKDKVEKALDTWKNLNM